MAGQSSHQTVAETSGPLPPRSGADDRSRRSDDGVCQAQMRDPATLLHRSALAAEDRWPLADRAKSLHDRVAGPTALGAVLWMESTMNVLDDYMVDPRLSLLDKTRIQAQVLVPILQALRSEL